MCIFSANLKDIKLNYQSFKYYAEEYFGDHLTTRKLINNVK